MTEPATAPVPAKGLFERAIGILFAPKATYAAVVATPKPAGILFVCALVIGIAQTAPQFTERGRQAAIAMNVQTVEKMTHQKVTDEAYASIERRQAYAPYFVVPSVLVFVPIVCLFFAAIYWAIFNAALGGTATFKQVLAVVTHSQVVGAVAVLISAPIQYMQGTVSVGGPFNLGVLVPMLDETSLVAKVLAATNPFTLWGIIVTGIGLSVLFRRSAMAISIALIVVYFVIATGITAVLGSLFG